MRMFLNCLIGLIVIAGLAYALVPLFEPPEPHGCTTQTPQPWVKGC